MIKSKKICVALHLARNSLEGVISLNMADMAIHIKN